MSGIKISQATPFSAAQDNDQFAVERGGQSGSLTQKKIAVQAGISEGFLKGDPSGVYAQNQTNDDKWQLDQKGLNIFGAAAETVNPDCTQNYCFNLQVDGDCTLDNPTNVPATNLGLFYLRLFAFTSDATSTLSFSANMFEMSGSKPWDVLNKNIIHCWYNPALGQTFYRVDNALPLPGEVQVAEITIPSADILTCNTTPVSIIPAAGAGKIILVKSVFGGLFDGTAFYTVDGIGYVIYEDQAIGTIFYIGIVGLDSLNNAYYSASLQTSSLANTVNKAIQFTTGTADPETGDYDLYLRLEYEVIDSPL